MTWMPSPVELRCAACQHRWTGAIAVQCSFALAIAAMDEICRAGCPACGAGDRSVLIDGASAASGPARAEPGVQP